MARYYFDYAAATPLDPDAARAMHEAEVLVGNPASLHAVGRAARSLLDRARKDIARVLNARETEIVFTSTATEADNLAIFGVVTASGEEQAEVLVAPTEHAAVRRVTDVVRASGFACKDLPLTEHGLCDVAALEKMITDKTILITIGYVTSEVGIIQPVGEIAKLVRKLRETRVARGITTPLILHTDASAAAGLLTLGVDRLGVDLMTLSSPKVYGPHGAAALYVRSGTPLTPHTIGGGQERGLRAGTENVPAIVGFAAALTKAERMRKDELKRLEPLRDELWSKLRVMNGIRRNGDRNQLANTLNVSIADQDGEDLVLRLDALGFAVATGAACAESSREPSQVLLGLGYDEARAQSSLRITLGRDTTEAAVSALAKAIKKVVQ
ncbi:cysteine desulfurase [bacterium]|nr:cysteine desulfurase [bacterium]